METITGTEAIRRARNLRRVNGAYFSLMHLTCNLATKECGEMVKIERARCRPALRKETFKHDGDMYFPYEDLDTEEPRMCFKRLMLYIRFPPNYELKKIDWCAES